MNAYCCGNKIKTNLLQTQKTFLQKKKKMFCCCFIEQALKNLMYIIDNLLKITRQKGILCFHIANQKQPLYTCSLYTCSPNKPQTILKFRDRHTWKEDNVKTFKEKMVVYKQGVLARILPSEPSEKTILHTLISNF